MENSLLLSELKIRDKIITESSLTANSSAKKKAAWAAITEAVKAGGGKARLPPAVHKPWRDMRDAPKTRWDAVRVAGGVQ